VREASNKQILENQEISSIKKIMGFKHGKEYADLSTLRYGKIMIMADQVRIINCILFLLLSRSQSIPSRITTDLILKAWSSTFLIIFTRLYSKSQDFFWNSSRPLSRYPNAVRLSCSGLKADTFLF